ncbi:hypothetical protein RYX36_000197, partial [Vicia faba]
MNGKEVMRKIISKNDLLRYEGITIYQTSWSISTLKVLKENEGPLNLAMAPLKISKDKKLYDKEWKFEEVIQPNSKLPINIDGLEVVIVDSIGSSGLDLK